MEALLTDGLNPFERHRLLARLEDLGRDHLLAVNPDALRPTWGETPAAQAAQASVFAARGAPTPIRKAGDRR